MLKGKIGRQLNAFLLTGPPGTGKKLLPKAMAGSPLASLILTPTGWTTMGEIGEGDKIIGRDGFAYNVTGLSHVKIAPMYRIEMVGGAVVKASDTHHWTVRNAHSRIIGDPYYGEERTKSTVELRSGKHNDVIPFPDPIQVGEREFLIPPYTMGGVLGDGALSGVARIDGADLEVLSRAQSECRDLWKQEFQIR